MYCNWLKNGERIVLSRIEKWFLLSKAVVSVALIVLVFRKMNKNDLPCPMRFKLNSKFQLCFIGEGKFSYPFVKSIAYQYLSVEIRDVDLTIATVEFWDIQSTWMSRIIFASLWHKVWLISCSNVFSFWCWRYSYYCQVESMGRCSSIDYTMQREGLLS